MASFIDAQVPFVSPNFGGSAAIYRGIAAKKSTFLCSS